MTRSTPSGSDLLMWADRLQSAASQAAEQLWLKMLAAAVVPRPSCLLTMSGPQYNY